MMRIAFQTLGCKVNQSDTASMELLFRQAGYEVVPFQEDADVYVVNTCVVTNTGQHKSRQMINRAVRKNEDALVVVAGCYPQTAAGEVKEIPGVDLILGNQDRSKVVSLVESALAAKRGGTSPAADTVEDDVKPWNGVTAFEEMAGGNEMDKTRAYLKIQEGCNQYCSYCIIPYARGPLRSRSVENIRQEVEALVERGYGEVVLIGIHLGCYGKELKDGTGLYDAVKAALSVPGLKRLRLGSLESVEVEDRLLDLMAADPRFCPHLHLPLQSGCDRILQTMRRPYDTARFKALLADIRKRIPGIAITTDIIVGFPGETEEEFETTYRFAEECGFSKMHIFPYSMRKGTPAADMKEQLPEKVKQARAGRLAQLDDAMQEAWLKEHLGRTVNVLVEQPCGDGMVSGLSEEYIRVEFPGDASLSGKIVPVKLEKALVDKCLGTCL